MTTRLTAALLGIVLAGCGGAPLHPGGHAGGGAGTTGGAGTGGAAGTGADAGTARSPGTVTLRLTVPAATSYCDATCGGAATWPHIEILTTDGQPVLTAAPSCTTTCAADCEPTVCPVGGACALQGVALTGDELSWDGRTVVTSTCGRGAISCYQPAFVPPGRYVAHMCAMQGKLEFPVDNQPPVCVPTTGLPECVDVPFDLPGPAVVEGTLSGSGPACRAIRASDYDQACKANLDCVNVAEGDFCHVGPNVCTNCVSAVVSTKAQAQYEADLAANTPKASVCPCPAAPMPVCNNGTCERGHFGLP